MGFGSGYSRRSDHGGKRYSNDMVAHVWNSQTEREGQSGNGNFYFRRRALYSYGSHFIVGFIMPDGVAMMNADSYSVSTSGHQSDARGAIKNRRHVSLAGLTDLAGDWKLLPRLADWLDAGKPADRKAEIQTQTRQALAAHAVALESPILAAGQWGYDSWDYDTTPATRIPFDRSGLIEAGAYLADLAGLPAASWGKIKREAAAARAKEAARKAKAATDAAEARAIYWSDMTDKAWRAHIARIGGESYSGPANLKSLATELRRARKLMMAAKGGKLAAAFRLASIRARIKRVAFESDRFAAMIEPRQRRQRLAVNLATVRNWRDASPEGKAAAKFHDMASLERAADYLAQFGRLAALRASAATLATDAQARAVEIDREEARKREEERARRDALHAERKADWLAGKPGHVRFDAETGGAAMRVMGDVLETSHGAQVPLAHAVKAFRFVKLMRERGTSWRRNGATIRVGHFQVDSIAATGDFTAGCHHFTWPEVERVAKLAGVFDCPADDAAVTHSHAA